MGTRTQRMQAARQRAYARQHGLCYWCRKPMHPYGVTGDHLVFKLHGGPISDENIVAACRPCNSKRKPAATGGWPWLSGLVAPRVSSVGWGPW